MKKILFLIPVLFSCAPSLMTVEQKTSILNEIYGNHNELYTTVCSNTMRAKTVQRRIKRRCSEPERYNCVLRLTEDQLNCTHKFLKNTYGYLNDYERSQIINP